LKVVYQATGGIPAFLCFTIRFGGLEFQGPTKKFKKNFLIRKYSLLILEATAVEKAPRERTPFADN
jgi:hypothetical protein